MCVASELCVCRRHGDLRQSLWFSEEFYLHLCQSVSQLVGRAQSANKSALANNPISPRLANQKWNRFEPKFLRLKIKLTLSESVRVRCGKGRKALSTGQLVRRTTHVRVDWVERRRVAEAHDCTADARRKEPHQPRRAARRSPPLERRSGALPSHSHLLTAWFAWHNESTPNNASHCFDSILTWNSWRLKCKFLFQSKMSWYL